MKMPTHEELAEALQNENIKMREALRRILRVTEVGSDEGSALALINTEAREALGEGDGK